MGAPFDRMERTPGPARRLERENRAARRIQTRAPENSRRPFRHRAAPHPRARQHRRPDPARARADSHGVALWKPVERDVLHDDCARCSADTHLPGNFPPLPAPPCSGVALDSWMPKAFPPLAARSSATFPTATASPSPPALKTPAIRSIELIYNLAANLDIAGFRFLCGEDNRWAGRLRHRLPPTSSASNPLPAISENGVPPKYGAGAVEIVAAVHKNPLD